MVGRAKRSTAICLAIGIAGCGSTKTATTTVTHTVTTDSPSCVQAYNALVQALNLLSGDVRTSVGYIPLIAQAAKAGEARSASQFRAVEAREKVLTGQARRYAQQLDKLNSSTHASARSCS